MLERDSGEGYWLPVDAEEDSQANWVLVHTVTSTLRAMSAKHVLVVADSCYSGTLTRDAPLTLATGADRLAELERMAAKRARKALTSGGLEPVFDGGGDGHSVFTRALLETLRANQDMLDGYEVYRSLRQTVVLNADQTPEYGDIRVAGDEGGEFVFVPVDLRQAPSDEAASAEALPDSTKAALDIAFWESIKDSDNAAAFQAYLEQFPAGTFASLAKLKLAELSSGEEVAALSAPEPEPYHGKLQAQVTLRCQPSADACMAIFGEKDGLILSFEGPLRVHQGEVVEASRVVSVPEAKMKVFITEGTVDSQRFTLRGTVIGKVTTDGTSLEPRQFDASGKMTEGRFTGSFLTEKPGAAGTPSSSSCACNHCPEHGL